MAHARQSDFATIRSDAVLDFKMAGLHPNVHTESMDREHTAFAHG
jgi:hypothetical protein